MTIPIQCTPLGMAPSFGFGDRIGLATPGHVAAMRRAGRGIAPIFAQQSIREMERTGRTPEQVLDDARIDVRASGYRNLIGADADHLKTVADIDATAGFTFFTLDPSGFVDRTADNDDEATLRTKFAAVERELPWLAEYRDRTIPLETGTTVVIDETSWLRAGVKYGRAINHAVALAAHLDRTFEIFCPGRSYEVELSVDETDQPTTPAEHWIIAARCLAAGMRLVSLAPRFIGDFEKGVDYKGDVAALEASLRDHAAIAELLGPYKLSLHSGSDKLSIYPALARATKGRFHVKTAGTSYLEALRVVAQVDEPLFRRVVAFARDHYDADKATYHVSATLAGTPGPDGLGRDDLIRRYLGVWDEVPAGAGFTEPGRQILHCTFGTTLRDPELGPAIRATLERHRDLYAEILADHFARHLDALRAGWPLGSSPASGGH